MRRIALLAFALVAVLALRQVVKLRRGGLLLTADVAENDTKRALVIAGVAFLAVRLATGSDVAALVILLAALWWSGVAGWGLAGIGIHIPGWPFGGGGWGGEFGGDENAVNLGLVY